jgi:hypothetical protein
MSLYEDVCGWGLFRPEHSGGYLCRMCPLSLELCQSPLHAGSLVWCVREWISDRGFIGSSGNVGVYREIRYRSLVMEYGETCIPGRMDDLPTILTVTDVRLSCDESHSYPNRSFWAFFSVINVHLWNLLFSVQIEDNKINPQKILEKKIN